MAIKEVKRSHIRTPEGEATLYERIDVTRTINYKNDDGQKRVRYEGTTLGWIVKGDLPVDVKVENQTSTRVSPTIDGQTIVSDAKSCVMQRS